MYKLTITNGMNAEKRIEDFCRKKRAFIFSSRELIELATNLDIFIEEYEEFCDEEYLLFLKTLQAKLLGYIHQAQHFESNQ